MLSHTHLGISDYDRAVGFYDALMAELGFVRTFAERDNGWAG